MKDLEKGILARIPQAYRILGLVMGFVLSALSVHFDWGPHHWLSALGLMTGQGSVGVGPVLVVLFTLVVCLLAVMGLLMAIATFLPEEPEEGAGTRQGRERQAWPFFALLGVVCFGLGAVAIWEGQGLSQESTQLTVERVHEGALRSGEPVVVSGRPVEECTISLTEIRRYDSVRGWELRWFYIAGDGEAPPVVVRARQLGRQGAYLEDPRGGRYRGTAPRAIRSAMARRGCDGGGEVLWVDQVAGGKGMYVGRGVLWFLGGLFSLGVAAMMRREEGDGGLRSGSPGALT